MELNGYINMYSGEKIIESKVIFESGKETYVNRGIIGINPELDISERYDYETGQDEPPFTKEECVELADFMIDLWQKFKQKYTA